MAALIAELAGLSDTVAIEAVTSADIDFAAVPKAYEGIRSSRIADKNSKSDEHDTIVVPWIDPNPPTSDTEQFIGFLRHLLATGNEEPFPTAGFIIETSSGEYSTVFPANSTPRLYLNLERFSRPGSFLQRQLKLADADDANTDQSDSVSRLINLTRYLFSTDSKLSEDRIRILMYNLFT